MYTSNECNNDSFLWRSEWISDFDSPWSMFYKFIFANNVLGKEFLEQFATERLSSTPHNELYTAWDRINWSKVHDLLAVQTPLVYQEFIQRWVKPIVHLLPASSLIRSQVYFCPKCISIGLHSMYHQYSLLNCCPFHNIPLQIGCPKCRLNFPFAPVSTGFDPRSLDCKCGFGLHSCRPFEPFSTVWKRSKTLEVRDDHVLKWLSLSSNELDAIRHNIWCNPEQLSSIGIRALTRIADSLSMSYNNQDRELNGPSGPSITSENPCIKIMIERTGPKFESNAAMDDLIELTSMAAVRTRLCEAYKSVMRFIRRHVVSEHTRCIRSLTLGRERQDCTTAMAYIYSRMLVEDVDSVRFVDNGFHSGKSKTPWPFLSAADNNMLESLHNTLRSIRSTAKAITWCMSNVLAFVILQRFGFLKNTIYSTDLYGLRSYDFLPALIVVMTTADTDTRRYWLILWQM